MRGEIEIIPGWDGEHCFAVMVWSRNRHSGYMARAFPTRQRAIDFAQGMVEVSRLTLHSADVVDMEGGAA